MKATWKILTPDRDSIAKIRKSTGYGFIAASIIANRGVSSEGACLFLSSSLSNIRSPFSLKDMDKSVQRIFKALQQNEKILIFADYDADGITGAAILFQFLEYCKANVSCYIPDRRKEGYGIKAKHITEKAVPEKVSLIITVDCGSSDNEAVDAAAENGIDIIITDHHYVSENPPSPFAFVNPKQKECKAGLDDLAGVGVVFYLLISLRKYLRDNNFWNNLPEPNLKEYCDLVAVGTVGDMVPLRNENRAITRTGLDIIKSGKRCSLSALARVCKIKNNNVSSVDISFKIAPLLNAAGRMQSGLSAFDLLCADTDKKAAKLAAKLDGLNLQRRETEKKVIEEIEAFLNKNPKLSERSSIVLFRSDWHEGILGIAAARIAKKYYKPVILVSIRDGIGKGSVRSVQGIDVYECLSKCAGLLENYGGHSLAAGITINPDNMKKFIHKFEASVQETIARQNFQPHIFIDYELNLANISKGLIRDIERLAPFGSANPEPLFMAQNVEVLFSSSIGKNHRRMRLRQNSRVITALEFNIDPALPVPKNFSKIAYSIQLNTWNGNSEPEIVVKHVCE